MEVKTSSSLREKNDVSGTCWKNRRNAFYVLVAISMVTIVSRMLEGRYIRVGVSHVIGIIFQQEYIIPHSSRCPECKGRNKTAGRFYNFSTPKYRLFAYSAFYDDRPSLLSSPVIRIIAIGEDFNVHPRSGNESSGFGLYCVFPHPNETVEVKMDKNARMCGPSYYLNEKWGSAYVLTCRATGLKPRSVSIMSRRANATENITSFMPVEYPFTLEKRVSVTVCVPVSYGQLNPYHLIEWIEIQRLFGVRRIAVYDLYLGEKPKRVLNYYAENEPGFVDFRKMDRIYGHELHAHLLELAASINDCLYRYMYSTKRIIVSDFDEFIRPTVSSGHRDIPSLVRYLETTVNFSKSVNYLIRNNFHFLEIEPGKSISPYFLFLRYRKRAPISLPFQRPKPIILTDACTHLFSHYCLGLTKMYSNGTLYEQINPDIARNEHYRRCPHYKHECDEMIHNSTIDNSMLEFKDYLRKKIKEKVLSIMGSVPEDF